MKTKQSVALVSTSALAAGMAQGAVIYSGPLDLQQNYLGAESRQAVDMTGDGVKDFTFGYEGDRKPYVDTRTFVSATISQSGIVNLLAKANTGFPVTPAGTMIDASYAATYPAISVTSDTGRGYMSENSSDGTVYTVLGDWPTTAVTDAYVGIELTLAGGTSYGWLHFIDDPIATTPSLTLVDWAYESAPGVGIQATAVPEPSTCALAGVGIATLLMLGKRR